MKPSRILQPEMSVSDPQYWKNLKQGYSLNSDISSDFNSDNIQYINQIAYLFGNSCSNLGALRTQNVPLGFNTAVKQIDGKEGEDRKRELTKYIDELQKNELNWAFALVDVLDTFGGPEYSGKIKSTIRNIILGDNIECKMMLLTFLPHLIDPLVNEVEIQHAAFKIGMESQSVELLSHEVVEDVKLSNENPSIHLDPREKVPTEDNENEDHDPCNTNTVTSYLLPNSVIPKKNTPNEQTQFSFLPEHDISGSSDSSTSLNSSESLKKEFKRPPIVPAFTGIEDVGTSGWLSGDRTAGDFVPQDLRDSYA